VAVSPPPLWQSLLLEQPWPAVIALIAVAAVVHLAARQRTGWAWRAAAPAVLLLAGGVWLLAHLVPTDREALLARTEALVHATAPLDTGTLDAILAPSVVLSGPRGDPWFDRTDLVDRLENARGRLSGFEHAIRGLGAEADDAGRGISVLDLRTRVPASGNLAVASKWTLYWRKDDAGRWRVTEIQWHELLGRDPELGGWWAP